MVITLPELEPGKKHGYAVYPDGRTELRQYSPRMLTNPDEAMQLLKNGYPVRLQLGVEWPRELGEFIENGIQADG